MTLMVTTRALVILSKAKNLCACTSTPFPWLARLSLMQHFGPPGSRTLHGDNARNCHSERSEESRVFSPFGKEMEKQAPPSSDFLISIEPLC
jgi:hypothetical protein